MAGRICTWLTGIVHSSSTRQEATTGSCAKKGGGRGVAGVAGVAGVQVCRWAGAAGQLPAEARSAKWMAGLAPAATKMQAHSW